MPGPFSNHRINSNIFETSCKWLITIFFYFSSGWSSAFRKCQRNGEGILRGIRKNFGVLKKQWSQVGCRRSRRERTRSSGRNRARVQPNVATRVHWRNLWSEGAGLNRINPSSQHPTRRAFSYQSVPFGISLGSAAVDPENFGRSMKK